MPDYDDDDLMQPGEIDRLVELFQKLRSGDYVLARAEETLPVEERPRKKIDALGMLGLCVEWLRVRRSCCKGQPHSEGDFPMFADEMWSAFHEMAEREAGLCPNHRSSPNHPYCVECLKHALETGSYI